MDRCRKLYEKYLEWAPENCYAWIKYTELEQSLGDTERARAIFELAIAQPALDMPELLWKVTNMFAIVCPFMERLSKFFGLSFMLLPPFQIVGSFLGFLLF